MKQKEPKHPHGTTAPLVNDKRKFRDFIAIKQYLTILIVNTLGLHLSHLLNHHLLNQYFFK